MLTLPPAVRVYVAAAPIDLHLSFDRLAGLVRGQLAADPLLGYCTNGVDYRYEVTRCPTGTELLSVTRDADGDRSVDCLQRL